jgi:hypothetical protein
MGGMVHSVQLGIVFSVFSALSYGLSLTYTLDYHLQSTVLDENRASLTLRHRFTRIQRTRLCLYSCV